MEKSTHRQRFFWLKAVRELDEAALKKLLEQGADPNWADQQGRSVAHLCASRENPLAPIILALAIEAGLDVDRQDTQGQTALMIAALWGNQRTARLLIQAGADFNATDKDGWTAAMWAAKNASHGCLADLIEAGADLVIEGSHGSAERIASLSRLEMACGGDGDRERCLALITARLLDQSAGQGSKASSCARL